MGQMTLRQLLQEVIAALTAAGVEDAGFDGLQLVCRHTGLSPARLRADGDRPADAAVLAPLRACVARRCAGEPLQYVLGEWEFFSLPFYVGPGVLIPRADTEILVDEALRFLEGVAAPRVADLCAGSGCVGLALAHERPDAAVTGVEVSARAAAYWRRNAARNRLPNAVLRQADVLAGPQAGDLFHMIMANPPYIPARDLPGLSREVRHEPALALNGGADGLTFYRAIIRQWTAALTPDGSLLFEVGAGQSEAVAALLQTRFQQVYTVPDLNGIPRVLIGTAVIHT